MAESKRVLSKTRSRNHTLALFLLLPLAARAQVSLSTAVDLAEKHSPAIRAARAEVDRAAAAVAQTRDAYAPSIVLGSSVGPPPYGFPLGNPDIYDVNADSLLFSFSQPDYVRAARSGLRAATLSLKDAQQQVALDAALDYVELDHDLKEMAALDEQRGYADALLKAEQDRVQAGVDPRRSQLDVELIAAQIDEKRIYLENDADLMRQKTSEPIPGAFPHFRRSPPPLPVTSKAPTTIPASEQPMPSRKRNGIPRLAMDGRICAPP
jgi:outer membrane protein TolC